MENKRQKPMSEERKQQLREQQLEWWTPQRRQAAREFAKSGDLKAYSRRLIEIDLAMAKKGADDE